MLVLLYRSLHRRGRLLLRRMAEGLAILGRPPDFVRGVVAWQALGRLIRLGSLACLMAASALPVTLATVVLAMAAQGAGRIVPIAPASAGLRIAMLSYGFVEVTGHAVDSARITAFSFGAGALLFATGLAISMGILRYEIGAAAMRHLLERLRSRAASASRLRPAAMLAECGVGTGSSSASPSRR